MRRVLVVSGVMLLVLAFLMPSPALAHVSFVTNDSFGCTIDCESQDIHPITGSITCTNGETFILRANVRQGGQTVAVGRANGTCTGSLQLWETNRTDNPLPFQQCGIHTHQGEVRTSDGSVTKIPQVVHDDGPCS